MVMKAAPVTESQDAEKNLGGFFKTHYLRRKGGGHPGYERKENRHQLHHMPLKKAPKTNQNRNERRKFFKSPEGVKSVLKRRKGKGGVLSSSRKNSDATT